MSEDIKIYHVETQEDYNDLMIKLENEGCMWMCGSSPTEEPYDPMYPLVHCDKSSIGDKLLSETSTEDANLFYPNERIIKYKAKGVEQMEKVVVPQFVADWYEVNKKFTMYGLLKRFEVGVKNEQLVYWIEAIGKGEAQRVIAKMHLFQDYEVEEKKCYWRKKKEHFLGFEYRSDSYYVNYNVDDNKLSFDDKEEDYPYLTKFTEPEIIDLLGEEGFKKLERVEFYE